MKRLFTIIFLVAGVSLFAQQFDKATIMDIQFLEDSVIALGDVPSPLFGDTLTIEGVTLAGTVADPLNYRRPILSAGGRWMTYIQDTSGQVWGGITVIQHDTTGTNQNTFFDLVDSAQVISVTGVVEEFFTTTQFSVLLDPIQPVSVVNVLNKRPDPIQLNITDFMTDGQLILQSEKYEGMYVEIKNVFTSDRNTSNGTFRINDDNGNYMFMYDQSGFFTLRGHRLTKITDYEPPNDGATLEFIRGVINTRTDGYYIVPLYPGDIKIGVTPPTISAVERDIAVVAPNQDVTISSKIIDLDGSVASASLIYRVDGGNYSEVSMSKNGNDSVYTAVIPGINQDSAFVDYFIKAVDDMNQVSLSPVDTTNNRFFFFVLNRDLKIQDVQYSPFGSGFSAYNNYEVSVTGIVTADTSDFRNMVYIQNGTGSWSGIRVFGTDIDKVKKGDNVTATGIVNESFGITRIGSLDNGVVLTVNSSGNPIPEPAVVGTGTIDLNSNGTIDAEQWESVLIKYENVTVTNYTADGNRNFGEILVDDGSGEARVELEDGNHSYGNGSMPSVILVNTGDKFTSLTGILHYSFGNYKLNPRNDGDFAGFISDVKDETIPSKFEISQNYPNPFNPTTNIKFSIPNSERVVVRVYDVLGRQVAELMNTDISAGTYTLTFNAGSLSSGIYIYKIQAGNFTAIKKMMLLK